MQRQRLTAAAGLIAAFVAAALPQSAQTERRYSWPPPKYKVRIEQDAQVPMRDGVKLATDLYFPEGVTGKLPVILIRTPYNKAGYRQPRAASQQFSAQGYIVSVQDTRGRFASEGDYTIQGNDTNDGYDTVDWLAKQPWSNGNIGTFGCSYSGDVQIISSKLRHPNLKCMVPQSAGSSIGAADNRYYFFGARKGGNVEVAGGLGWFANNGNKDRGKAVENLPEDRFRKYWATLPLTGMIERAGGPRTDWDDVASRELTDPWWEQGGYLKGDEKFDVPALHINSWYDFGVYETLLEFNLLRTNAVSDRARNNQFAVISPTSHCRSEIGTTANTIVGERELGDAQLDYYTLYLQWFDFWLKGIDNGVTKRPKLILYVMGRNQWRAENEWPLARTQYTKYYLHSDGRANSRWGSGGLSTTTPKSEPTDRFTYDPRTPVPSRGGPLCCTGTPDAAEGSFDQSEVEARNDVLVYTTPELREGVEATGPIKAVLYVSSSARDTDFTVKLVDVYPDGRAFNVQEGILRARHREGFTKKVWMNAGEVYELAVDLEATSNYFAPGHRMRIEVSSSNFPRFDRNLNTGGDNYNETKWVIAENKIHHSAGRASYILLPVIP